MESNRALFQSRDFRSEVISVKTERHVALNFQTIFSGGVNPFLQVNVYKSFCISRLLYGFEIMFVNKKTLNILNLKQSYIFRYMTGLSKNSHISGTL
jgi:hypothetical protein